MNRIKKAAALVAAAGCLLCAHAQRWQNLYPSYSGLAFGDGNFVAVSRDGLIMVSGGAEWTRQHFPSTGGLLSAAYGDGLFVVTQNNASAVLRSEDARNWSAQIVGSTDRCSYLAFGDGNFIGVGEEGATFLYDGEDDWGTWPVAGEASQAAYGAGRYVVAGSAIWSSANARGWQLAASPSGGVGAMAFGDGKFAALSVSGAAAYTSADGVSWANSPAGAPAGMADMAFGGGKFVAVGSGGGAAVSGDGASWTAAALNADDSFRAVEYGNGMFMALGANGSVYTSADGAAWSKLADGRFMSYRQIAKGGSMFAAVGDSGVSVSGDGKDWAKKSAGRRLQSVAYGAGRFVAVGDSGAIFSSADGNSWERSDDADAGMMLGSVAFGNGIFIAAGRAAMGPNSWAPAILTSADGRAWTDRSADVSSAWGSIQPAAVGFGGGTFVAAGSSNGSMKISSGSDGRFWSSVTLPDEAQSYRIVSVAYSENRFVALGTTAIGAAMALSSADGLAWTAMPAPAGSKSATFAKGFYMIAADSGYIYASQNGSNWVPQGRVTNRNLQTIYFADNVLLAAGAAGAMLYSAETPSEVSIRHGAQASRKTSRAFSITMENARSAPTVRLSFAPEKPGTISVYSLSGKQLYKKRLNAGERAAQLPKRAMNGSVIVRYAGDGMTISERFQMIR
jgi:hypothetical protein